MTAACPRRCAEIADDFADVGAAGPAAAAAGVREELPALPERYADAAELMEQVHECQSPLFLAVEVEDADDRTVHLFFDAPAEAPTTRGFAGDPARRARRAARRRGAGRARTTFSVPARARPGRSARCGCAAWWRCSRRIKRQVRAPVA